MPTQQEEPRDRTKKFAIRIVRVYRALPFKTDAQVLGKQLIRSGTGVAANYRAACRSRSRAEWVAKIGIVVEEADETVFWLEMLSECDILPTNKLAPLLAEAHELSAIFTVIAIYGTQNSVEVKLQDYQITKLQNQNA